MQRSFRAGRRAVFPATMAGALPVAIAAIVAALAASPALAFSSFTLQSTLASFTPRESLLSGSLALLVIALIARLMRGRKSARQDGIVEDVPDLRWWRNPIAAELVTDRGRTTGVAR